MDEAEKEYKKMAQRIHESQEAMKVPQWEMELAKLFTWLLLLIFLFLAKKTYSVSLPIIRLHMKSFWHMKKRVHLEVSQSCNGIG